jgi:hypothetical protein
VAADALGNLFWEALKLLPGANRAQQLESLWGKIQAYYAAGPAGLSKLHSLTLEMIKQTNKGPKLRGKASQVKSLVPFALSLATELCKGSPRLDTMRNCILQLSLVYKALDQNPWPAREAAAAARKFMLLYAALQAEQVAINEASVFWKIKPKHHLMLELIEFIAPVQGNPREYWCYADEDFGGWLVRLAARRGGARNPQKIALDLFKSIVGMEHMTDVEM